MRRVARTCPSIRRRAVPGGVRPRSMRTLVLSLLAASACSDVSGIENKKAYGPAIAMIDLFTTCYLVKTDVGPILIDACWRPEELRVRLSENGVKPEDVGTVLLPTATRTTSRAFRFCPTPASPRSPTSRRC